MQNKIIKFLSLTFFILIVTSCGGGGSGSAFNQVDQTTATFSISDQNINQTMQPINTIGDINIDMTNTSTHNLNIESINIDDVADMIESTSTCIGKSLEPTETCTITVKIDGVYTSSTNVNLLIDANNTQLKQSIKVFNYNYTHNLADTNKIQVDSLTDNSHLYDSSNKFYSITGKRDENIITITNKESSPLAIESVIFTPDLIIATPNNVVNKVIPEKSSCVVGTKLLPNQSCDVVIYNVALSNGHNFYYDNLSIKFAGIDSLNVIWIYQTIDFFGVFPTIDCKTINECPLKVSLSGYKATLDRFKILYYPAGTIVDPTSASDHPCVYGADFTDTGYCNLNISIESGATITDNELWLDFDVRVYLDDNNYILLNSNNPKGVLDLRDYDIQRPQIGYIGFSALMSTSYIDEHNTFIPVPNGVVVHNYDADHGGLPLEIQGIRVIPGSTNFMNIDQHQLITAESMLFTDGCTGQTLTKESSTCELEILTGMNAYGSAGTLVIDYSIGGGATQSLPITLHDVAQADLEVYVENPDPNNSEYIQVWRVGDIIQPIYTRASKVSSGIQIANDTNETGTYVMIDYDGNYTPVTPNCLAWDNAVGGYMYNGYYYCAYSFDFSKKNVGDVVKTKLIMGNHKETVLEVNFTITD